ncbi:MAG: hypothetical protein ACOH2H_07735 [Cypionkella sp.]
MTMTLHIGTLSLPHMPEAEAARAARSFEDTLTALLNRDGLPPGVSPRDLARIDLGTLNIAAGDSPEALGRTLARALYDRVWS